jgi:hypothetical protein
LKRIKDAYERAKKAEKDHPVLSGALSVVVVIAAPAGFLIGISKAGLWVKKTMKESKERKTKKGEDNDRNKE